MVGVSGSCGILVSFDSNIARNGHINGSRISAGNLPPMPAEYTDKCRTKGYHKNSHFGLDFMSFRVSTYFVAEGYFIYIFLILSCLCRCCPCAACLYCTDCARNVEHYCPLCNTYLGAYER